MEGIWSEIISKEMGVLAAAIIAVMLFLGRIPVKGGKKKLNDTKLWKNWGIFVMFGLATAGSFMPGIHKIPREDWGSILVFAFTTAMVALLGRAILKPIVLAKLEGKKPTKE